MVKRVDSRRLRTKTQRPNKRRAMAKRQLELIPRNEKKERPAKKAASKPAIVQRAAEEAFEPGARGAVVALDPRNGDVLALASKPNYDPNEFSMGITQERWSELSSGGNYPLFNRAIQAAYPPGSTIKPFTALAGLENGVMTPGTFFAQSCTGEFRFGTRLFGCWKHEGHGSLSMHNAIVRSCDVYFYQLGIRIGLERLSAFMSKLTLSD